MKTEILTYNDITIVLSYFLDDMKVYGTYHRNNKQVMDWFEFTTFEQKMIQQIVTNYCQFYDLHLYSY